uniref:Ubiquitin-conjugating enzyme E2 27-like n=1 Tax=Tanacetum cinerariifolium TaxID=118510 RepID=A0A6L2KRL7_TANCI|nr:ubiquitin-conjugating enzyme E2 27-like [Tanacetum cinerariifolium]
MQKVEISFFFPATYFLEPKDPQDAFVSKQYLTYHDAFTATAWRWTKDFAMVSSAEYNRKVQKLIEMYSTGFI